MSTSESRVKRFGPAGRIARIPTPTGFPIGAINSYVVLPEEPDRRLLLVDTGVRTEAAWEALCAGLASLGFGVEDVGLLLLTHAHPDHFGQAARIVRAAGCEVWGHAATPEAIGRYARETPPERMELLRAFLRRLGVPAERAHQAFGPPGGREIVEDVAVDRLLEDGDRVEWAGLALDVVHVPGHCPDLVVYWHAESGSLLSGDHLLPDITPVCLIDVPEAPDGPRVATLVQYHESLDKVEPLPVRLVLPSHGDVLPTHRPLIADYRLHTARRALDLARLLARGDATPFDLGRRMFPKVWDAQLHLVLSEVVGHLDLLERDGHARCEVDGDVLRYRFVSLPDPA